MSPPTPSPSRTDPLVRVASAVVGGPAGRRLAPAARFLWAAPVLVLLAVVVLAGGVVQKQHCRAQGWSSPDQFWHACYSDIAVLYGNQQLGVEGGRPGLQQAAGPTGLGQPPLAAAAMWVVSAFTPDDTPAPGADDEVQATAGAREFFDLSTAVLALALAVAVGAVAVTAGRIRGRPWDAAQLALAPVLVTAGLVSYSLLAVALLALTLWAWHRDRPVQAGIWLGLGVAASPAMFAVGFALLVLAARTRWRTPTTVGVALATWFVTRLVLVGGFGGLLGSFNAWRSGLPGYGSLWLVPQLLGDARPNDAGDLSARLVDLLLGWLFRVQPMAAGTAAALSLLLFAALVFAVVRFTGTRQPDADSLDLPDPLDPPETLDPPGSPDEPGPLDVLSEASPAGHRPRHLGLPPSALAPLALAVLAAALLVATTLPPQSSLLLLPLMALSGLRWRDHLIWATTECAYFVGVWLYIAGQSDATRGLPASVFLALLLARLAGIAWVGVQGVLGYRASAEAVGLRLAPAGRDGGHRGRHPSGEAAVIGGRAGEDDGFPQILPPVSS